MTGELQELDGIFGHPGTLVRRGIAVYYHAITIRNAIIVCYDSQVNYKNWVASSGIPALSFVVGDRVATPPEFAVLPPPPPRLRCYPPPEFAMLPLTPAV